MRRSDRDEASTPARVKVLHVITRFLKWGGSERNTLQSIQGLDPNAYEVDLAVGRDAQMAFLRPYPHGEVIQILALQRNPHPIRDLLALLRLYRLMRRKDYDIVHTHQSKAGILGRLAAKLAGVPVIVHGLHGTMASSNPVLDRIYLGLDRFTGRLTDRFVSVGRDLRERYVARGIGDPSRYCVIRSGMDLQAFRQAGDHPREPIQRKRQELGIDHDALVVGQVASLEPRKGHQYAIQAAEALREHYPELVLLLVGDGWHRAELESFVDDRGLGDVVRFVGYRDDVTEVIATFDVAMFTSLWGEGLPQVLVQAAAAGVPIVTFDVEGACEVVHEGVNGFIVPTKDVQGLADRIGDLLDDPERARAMGAQGREIVGDEWAVETMQRKTRELYAELVEQRLRDET